MPTFCRIRSSAGADGSQACQARRRRTSVPMDTFSHVDRGRSRFLHHISHYSLITCASEEGARDDNRKKNSGSSDNCTSVHANFFGNFFDHRRI